MGGCKSKEEVEGELAREEEDLNGPSPCRSCRTFIFEVQELKNEFELSKQALAELDQTTRVPHLLLEIRSLGFVEVQGKDTGGIYKRLEARVSRQNT